MLKIPVVKFLEEIQKKSNKPINISFSNEIKDKEEYYNCYRWFTFIPNFLLNNKELLSTFIKFAKDDEVERNRYKKAIKKYNNLLENNFNKVVSLFKQYFPGFFKKVLFKKRYSSSFDCDFYDLEFTNFKNETYFLQEFYNTASEGEIKILNLFLLLLEFDVSSEKFNFLLCDDFLSSFDNANVTIILKILEDFLKDKNYYLLSLTHDFEIYRILNNVFNLEHDGNKMFRLNKDIIANSCTHNVNLSTFNIRNDFYIDYLKTKTISNYKIDTIYLLSMLSHYRNIVEIYNGNQEGEYLKITNFLHLKDKSPHPLLEIFDSYFYKSTNIVKQYNKLESKGKVNNLKKYIYSFNDYHNLMNDLFSFTEKSNLWDKNTLEARIFYSLYSRIIMENWLLEFIKEKNRDFSHLKISSNQTEALISIIEGTDKEKIFNGVPLYNEKMNNVKEIIDAFKKLKQLIPDYIHIKYNEVSYLINIDASLLYGTLVDVKSKIDIWNKSSGLIK